MAHLIYRKTTGKIDTLRQHDNLTGPEIIEMIYGKGADVFYGSMPWFEDYPTGKKVVAGEVVADPAYVAPVAPPAV